MVTVLRYRSLFLLFLLIFHVPKGYSKTVEGELESTYLGKNRKIKIQLPKDYNANKQEGYPLVLVLEADHLFGMVAGTVHYLSSWREMPQSIVVGIMKPDSLKQNDYLVDDMRGMPSKTGANFFDFLEKEALPALRDNYNLDGFITVVGHGKAAAYINFFLMRSKIMVNAVVSASPAQRGINVNPIRNNLTSVSSDIFYVLGASNEKVEGYLGDRINQIFSSIDHDYIHYKAFSYPEDGHYLMTPKLISDAFKFIYQYYRPISHYEYKKKIIPYKGSKVTYFKDRMEKSARCYGKPLPQMLSNYQAIYQAIKTEPDSLQLESLRSLAEVSIKKFPKAMFGYCFKAEYFHKNGELKKAMKTYRKAFLFKEVPDFPYSKNYLFDKQKELQFEMDQ